VALAVLADWVVLLWIQPNRRGHFNAIQFMVQVAALRVGGAWSRSYTFIISSLNTKACAGLTYSLVNLRLLLTAQAVFMRFRALNLATPLPPVEEISLTPLPLSHYIKILCKAVIFGPILMGFLGQHIFVKWIFRNVRRQPPISFVFIKILSAWCPSISLYHSSWSCKPLLFSYLTEWSFFAGKDSLPWGKFILIDDFPLFILNGRSRLIWPIACITDLHRHSLDVGACHTWCIPSPYPLGWKLMIRNSYTSWYNIRSALFSLFGQ